LNLPEAYDLISRAIDGGHAAHGYLVCGELGGGCEELAGRLLLKLFPDEREQIERRCHPDVVYLEPEGKSRTIHTASMRERLIEPMSTTAFSGGWKVGVIVGADRMELSAANSFLKSLEEPPPKTLYLLLTDQPDAMLPTIVSRTQRIDLPMPPGLLEGEACDAVAEVMSAHAGEGVFEKARLGKRLAEILGEIKDESEDAGIALARKAFYRTVMAFVRDWMIRGRLPLYMAFRNVEAVEDAYRQSERSMNDEAVLCNMADRLVWP
jgi:DNA polymerase-3 subunit delta'